MPGTISESRNQLIVPTIDISNFIFDPSSAGANEVVKKVRDACVETGFFQIVGHGMPKQIQDGLFQASKKFFALPMDEKLALDARKTVGRRGYDALESQAYDPKVLSDLKEASSLGPDEFREPVEQYYQAINQLALKILELVARTLPYNTEIFSRFSSGHVIAPLRLLHYPPALAQNQLQNGKTQFGAGAHTDFGAITLLIQDENSGLEVWDPRANGWISVKPTPEAFVVNVGDMLSAWTGGSIFLRWEL
ncbi:hypothetical protein ONZ43_g842 [Nemania bipapillata]|uniref:Uncharacterized protein n=1 Tax=Nemania bipapillata TaxID=110536 RepID=A0ACC2J6S6_9PEZI|nr:hypothetical protein ONZ43_g842 [Nemania bipapillata]